MYHVIHAKPVYNEENCEKDFPIVDGLFYFAQFSIRISYQRLHEWGII